MKSSKTSQHTNHTQHTTPADVPDAASSTSASALGVIPSEAAVATLVDALETIRTSLASVATPMTTDQRRRAVRARKGGDLTATLMASLGKQYGVQIPGVDPDHIAHHALLVQRLQPLETKLRVVAGLVNDTMMNAKGQTWDGTTSLYTALARASRRNPNLQRELEPAVAFFRPKKKGTAKTGASGGSPPNTAGGGTNEGETTSPPPAPAPAPIAGKTTAS